MPSCVNPNMPTSFVETSWSFVQHPMDQLHACRSFTHRRCDALRAAAAHVAHGKDAWPVGLEQMRRPCVSPLLRDQVLGVQVRSRSYEPFVVQGNASLQPARVGHRTGHEKYVLDFARLALPA